MKTNEEPIRVNQKVTLNSFPYNRPNEIWPNAPEPTHRVIGFGSNGIKIRALRGSGISYTTRDQLIPF